MENKAFNGPGKYGLEIEPDGISLISYEQIYEYCCTTVYHCDWETLSKILEQHKDGLKSFSFE